jgi:hypothetical protein
MFEIISIFFSITTMILSFLLYRSIERVSVYEEMHDDIYKNFYQFSETLNDVLSREIYSNDSIVVNLINETKDMQWFIEQLSDNYRFNLLAESVDETT